MRKTSLLAILLAFSAHQAFAQTTTAAESQSKIKVEDAKGSKNKVDGDVDQEVTNPLLRATMGSKSRWSMSTTVIYSGASVERPFAAMRPDIYGTPDVQFPAELSTSLGVRYRLTKSDSFTFGTSFGVRTPLQGHVDNAFDRKKKESYREGQFNVGDPTIGYNRTFAGAGLQHSMSVFMSAGTSVESRRVGTLVGSTAVYTFLKAFQSGVTLGLTSSLSGFVIPDAQVGAQRFRFATLPFVEYAFNDKFRFRTISRYTWWQNNHGTGATDWMLLRGSQSAGIGMSFTRDIWVYPNIQWDWNTPLSQFASNTNVGINATINMF
jgi:hypothetical protein